MVVTNYLLLIDTERTDSSFSDVKFSPGSRGQTVGTRESTFQPQSSPSRNIKKFHSRIITSPITMVAEKPETVSAEQVENVREDKKKDIEDKRKEKKKNRKERSKEMKKLQNRRKEQQIRELKMEKDLIYEDYINNTSLSDHEHFANVTLSKVEYDNEVFDDSDADLIDGDFPNIDELHLNDVSDISELEVEYFDEKPGRRTRQQKIEREERRIAKQKRKKAGKVSKNVVETGINFKQVNRDLKSFLTSDLEQTILQPMEKKDREVVHRLAACYNLKTKSHGKRIRSVMLIKTKNSRMPTNFSLVDSIIRRTIPESLNSSAKPQTPQPKPYKEASIVGENADPVSNDNIGNLMLRKLGWSPGSGLGKEKKGIQNPIEAVYKSNRKGLI